MKKIHLRTNGSGLPAAVEIAPGQASDYAGALPLLDADGPEPKVLSADRGYDANWLLQPMQLLIVSVQPTCAAFMQTTVSMDRSLTASITPRRYSARRVDHFPGAALASGLR